MEGEGIANLQILLLHVVNGLTSEEACGPKETRYHEWGTDDLVSGNLQGNIFDCSSREQASKSTIEVVEKRSRNQKTPRCLPSCASSVIRSLAKASLLNRVTKTI